MAIDDITELRRRVPGGKYNLARAIAERARQLQGGALPLIEVKTPNPLSVAIDEICAGKVSFHVVTEEQQAEAAAAALLEAQQEAEKPPAEAPKAATGTENLLTG